MVYTTHISYLEIYNEMGYDLLDPRHEASRLEDLPSVQLTEFLCHFLFASWSLPAASWSHPVCFLVTSCRFLDTSCWLPDYILFV